MCDINSKQKSQYIDYKKSNSSFATVMSKSRKVFDNFNWDEITKHEILESIYNDNTVMPSYDKFPVTKEYFDSVELSYDQEYNKFDNKYSYDDLQIEDDGNFVNDDFVDDYYEFSEILLVMYC